MIFSNFYCLLKISELYTARNGNGGLISKSIFTLVLSSEECEKSVSLPFSLQIEKLGNRTNWKYIPSEIKPPLADVITYRFGNKLSFAGKTFRNVRCNWQHSIYSTHLFSIYVQCILADSGFFLDFQYQIGVKSTVLVVFEDLKFKTTS